MKREKDLLAKKDKLFKSKDFSKWGYDPEILQKHSKELLKDKIKSHKFMLPEETK